MAAGLRRSAPKKFSRCSLEQLTENSSIAWSMLYNQHIDTIKSDPEDVL